MKIDSMENLCKFLISTAFQRCRKLDDLCRLSVSLLLEHPVVRISVSDTGVGSILEEFQELKGQIDPVLASKWDGVLSVATTGFSDNEIHNIKLDIKEIVSSKRIRRLPSISKNGAKFSGTEVSVSFCEKFDVLVAMTTNFIKKMLLLKSPKIAIELSLTSEDGAQSQAQCIVLQDACSFLPADAANIDCLKYGLEDYVSRHGNTLIEDCCSCFSARKNLRVGSGVASCKGKSKIGEQVMEAVIIISEVLVPTQSSCFRLYGKKTEVLYYRDFSPCSICSSSLDALTSIPWKKHGLTIKSVADQDGLVLLEWDNLPSSTHIDIVLHIYSKQAKIAPSSEDSRIDRVLTKKAIKLALKELKERNTGVFLSERARKISSYAPDLAKTISSLILSSNDSTFREQCLSLQGLQSQQSERNIVENCISDRLLTIISKNDVRSWESRESSFLFVDDEEDRMEPLDEDYEEVRYSDS